MRIVADENIPLVAEAFGDLGPVRRLPGAAIDAAAVRAADVLLVRSVTPVDGALVAGSRLRFVGSATIGTDHVDVEALAALGIPFHHAPGSNASSVAEWVLAVLLRLAAGHGVPLRGRTMGVVGCGNTGGRVARRAEALGMRVLRNDPPLAEGEEAAGRQHTFVPLSRLLEESDVLSLHVPLARGGPHPTHHLLDGAALARLRPGAWLLNCSRGAVVDGAVLLGALRGGRPGAAALDVWEGEPAPDPELIRTVEVATPHVAGYSWDGKVAGTRMLREALAAELGLAGGWAPPDPDGALALAPPPWHGDEAAWLHGLVRQMYDVGADDARTRSLAELPTAERAEAFRRLRRDYPRRRSYGRWRLPPDSIPAGLEAAVRVGLGVS